MDDVSRPIDNSLNHMKGSGQIRQDADEIDLFELWNNLLKERWLIIAITGVVTLAAGLYAFLATPVYQSQAYFLPPSVEDVQEMNALNLLTNKDFYQPDEVYEDFITYLNSREVLKQIFNQYGLASLYESEVNQASETDKTAIINKAFEEFSEDIALNLPKKNDVIDEISINLSLKSSPEKTADILNSIVKLAEQKTIAQYLRDIESELSIRKQRINDQIFSLRQIEKERRLDRIVRLEEAASIAHDLNLSEPVSMGPQVRVQGVANQGLPLYYLGYKLLEAELDALKVRKNDDPFITDLRGLQQELAELNSLKLDASKFGVVTIDQAAEPAAKPVKPKKTLIVLVGLVFGLMFGIFIALIRSGLKNRQVQA